MRYSHHILSVDIELQTHNIFSIMNIYNYPDENSTWN